MLETDSTFAVTCDHGISSRSWSTWLRAT